MTYAVIFELRIVPEISGVQMISAVSEFEQQQDRTWTVIRVEQLYCDIVQVWQCCLNTHRQHVNVRGLDAQSCQ